jgi:putative ABC transport system permease protein
MTAPWRKALRDVQQESARSLLVILAMAVGIAAFTAVLACWAVLTRELDRGYLATNPASARITTDAVDDALLTAVRASPAVDLVEPRRRLAARLRVGPGPWRSLVLFVVADYRAMRVSTLAPELGAWPPGRGEILIERDALGVAGAQVGDAVTVVTRRGNQASLQLTGSVHDVGQAQARMENVVYGYITLATLGLLGEPAVLDRLDVVVSGERTNEAKVRDAVATITKVITAAGHPILALDLPHPGRHPHADLMGVLLAVMAAFGLFVFLLSGVVAANLLAALMATQRGQIGVMKTLGGSRWQIARIYLAQAVLLGATAILLGLPLGLWGSRVLARAQATFLNFDLASYAVPGWVFLLVAAVGLAVPLVAAALPVWRACAVPARQSLTDVGVSSGDAGGGWLDRRVARLRGPSRPVLLAIRNSLRRRARLALTLVTLSTAGVFFMAALNLRASMIHTLDRLFAGKRFDLSVALVEPADDDAIQRAVAGTPGVLRAEGWSQLRASLPPESRGAEPTAVATTRAAHGHEINVVVTPIPTDFLRHEITAGRDLRAGDGDAVVVSSALAALLAARAPAYGVGTRMPLLLGGERVEVQIVGVAREPFSPPVAYVSRAFLDRTGRPTLGRQVRLRLDDASPAAIARVKARLEDDLVAAGLHPSSITSKADSRFRFDQHMLMIYVFLIVMSGLLGVVGGLGLTTTMSLNVLERRRELGVLRAIGATPSAIAWIVVGEGCLVGVLGWAIAALASWPLSSLVGDLVARLVFKSTLAASFDARGVGAWLAISIVLGAVASVTPAWHASRRPLREALSHA